MIEFEFIDLEIPGFNSEFFVYSLTDLIKCERKSLGEITVVFCSDDYLLDVNKQYLNHDYFTDIITFDYSEGLVMSGDLFISYDRVLDNANTFNVEVLTELSRVIFHGVLHLCGYKDKSDMDVILMRDKENFYLDRFVSRETNQTKE
jgi:probable rRNA maturation factor